MLKKVMKLNIKNFILNKKKSTNRTYFIAEIGVNHNGSLSLAKKMILAAKKSGANAVKFQTFKAEDLVTPQTQKVNYQKTTTSPNETHYEMIKSLELSILSIWSTPKPQTEIGIYTPLSIRIFFTSDDITVIPVR